MSVTCGTNKVIQSPIGLKTDFINGGNLQSWFSAVDWSENSAFYRERLVFPLQA